MSGRPVRTGRAGGDAEAAERRRPTINDVARLAGVSKKTVSRVINEAQAIKRETRERVEAVIRDLGYRPDSQARGLAFRRSFLMGLIYNNPNPQYVIDMQQGILDAVRGAGLELVVHPCDRADPRMLDAVRSFIERQKLFGVVLTPSISEDERVHEILRELDCPYVRVASVPLDTADNMIVTHDWRGAAEAARHLVDLGHRRVGFISGPALFRSAHERRRGFAEGLFDRNVALGDGYDRVGAYTFESGRTCAEALLALPEPPTAVFAGNDEMAAGVYHAARARGLSIPEDLSVVGFDDSALAARLWPPLTSVRLPIRDMGRFAAEKLIERGTGVVQGEGESGRAVSPRLVVRASTSAPPG